MTPEDEDRRRRRRERNKIAATKCRMKKRERTANLINESETLESQNIEFKTQIRDLENQRRKLMEILQNHSPHCVHQGGYQPLPSVSTLKNCKYLNDLDTNNFNCDLSMNMEMPEIKYSHTLKAAGVAVNEMNAYGKHMQLSQMQTSQQQQQQQQQSQQMQQQQHDELEFKANQMLPHGYCKPSPSDTNYVLSPDSGFVRSPIDLNQSSPYHHPDHSPHHTLAQHNHHPHHPTTVSSSGLKTNHTNNNYNNNIPTQNDSSLMTNNNNNNLTNNNMNGGGGNGGDTDFILKSELIDAHSPYTTMQSADRFLFEGTDTFDSDKLTPTMCLPSQSSGCNSHLMLKDGHCTNLQIQHNASVNMLMTMNGDFDANLMRADFLNNPQEFISMPDSNDTQFTDLDSGIIKSLNNGCLV